MDGLECSEVFFSQIDLGDRFDAEYFAKEYIRVAQNLENVHTKKLGAFANFVASAFYPAATQLYSIGDTAFVRCVDCIDFPIITAEQEDRFEKIPYSFGTANKGVSFLTQGEIVITKVGTPCYASIVEDYETVALSRTVLGLSKIKGIDPYYLMVFLRCKYGYEQLYRKRELTIQYQLTLPRVKAVDVYLATSDFQKVIRHLCEQYRDVKAYSYSTSFDGEGAITSAINYVTTEELPKIYILEGHGEAELPASFRDQIEKENMETESLSLLTVDAIPEDADCVMIYAPSSDISQEERDLLADYASEGGKLFVAAGPVPDSNLDNLYSLLADYGIEANEGVVVEPNREHYSFQGPLSLLPDMNSHAITDSLMDENYSPTMPVSLGLTVPQDSESVTALLTTSESAFSKLDGYDMTDYEKEDGDIDGPFALAVSIDTAGEG